MSIKLFSGLKVNATDLSQVLREAVKTSHKMGGSLATYRVTSPVHINYFLSSKKTSGPELNTDRESYTRERSITLNPGDKGFFITFSKSSQVYITYYGAVQPTGDPVIFFYSPADKTWGALDAPNYRAVVKASDVETSNLSNILVEKEQTKQKNERENKQDAKGRIVKIWEADVRRVSNNLIKALPSFKTGVNYTGFPTPKFEDFRVTGSDLPRISLTYKSDEYYTRKGVYLDANISSCQIRSAEDARTLVGLLKEIEAAMPHAKELYDISVKTFEKPEVVEIMDSMGWSSSNFLYE